MRAFLPGHVRRAIEGEARRSADGRETGGILLGFGGGDGEHWVTQAGGPGPAAVRSATRFVRDLGHSEVLAEAAYGLDGSQWIGDWHTHLGGPPLLSGTDLGSYRRVLANSDLDLFLAILALPSASGWQRPRLHSWSISAERIEPVALLDPLAPPLLAAPVSPPPPISFVRPLSASADPDREAGAGTNSGTKSSESRLNSDQLQ